MMYNADFLIAAVVILLLVLRNFLDQKRAEDLNSRVFLFFVVIGILIYFFAITHFLSHAVYIAYSLHTSVPSLPPAIRYSP